MEHSTVVSRSEKARRTTTAGRTTLPGVPGRRTRKGHARHARTLSLRFKLDPAKAGEFRYPGASCCSTILRPGRRRRPRAARPSSRRSAEPVSLSVAGGAVVHGNRAIADDKGYNDQEGCYEIRKTGDPLTVTLPAGRAGRTIRVKAVARRVMGRDGHPRRQGAGAQLHHRRRIADDPLAPIREQPEAPRTPHGHRQALRQAQTLTLREQEGIQLVYQTGRPGGTWHLLHPDGPALVRARFSMVDGHARNMRAYGKQDWALPRTSCSGSSLRLTPEQMLTRRDW